MNKIQLEKLVRSLVQSQESEWSEFKANKVNHDDIGQNISAISNSIALLNRDQGYYGVLIITAENF